MCEKGEVPVLSVKRDVVILFLHSVGAALALALCTLWTEIASLFYNSAEAGSSGDAEFIVNSTMLALANFLNRSPAVPPCVH